MSILKDIAEDSDGFLASCKESKQSLESMIEILKTEERELDELNEATAFVTAVEGPYKLILDEINQELISGVGVDEVQTRVGAAALGMLKAIQQDIETLQKLINIRKE